MSDVETGIASDEAVRLRMARLIAGLLALATALLGAADPLRAETSAPRIRLQSCVVAAAGVGNIDSIAAQMKVRFVNESAQTLKRIVWRAQTPSGTVDFVDAGTFTPGVSIYRPTMYKGAQSKRSSRLAFYLMGPGLCAFIETEGANGEIWKASGLAPAAIEIPPGPSDSATPVPSTFDNPEHNPIGIISCRFSLYWGRSHGTVRFRNLSPRPIDSVTFRGFFGEAGIDVVKQGTFTTGALVNTGDMIRRELPANAYQEYESLDSPRSCVAVSAHYVDGSTWQNPSVSPSEPPFPVGVP